MSAQKKNRPTETQPQQDAILSHRKHGQQERAQVIVDVRQQLHAERQALPLVVFQIHSFKSSFPAVTVSANFISKAYIKSLIGQIRIRQISERVIVIVVFVITHFHKKKLRV